MTSRLVLLLTAGLVACSASQSTDGTPEAPSGTAAPTTEATAPASSSPPAATASASVAAPTPSEAPAVRVLDFTQRGTEKIHSIAFGKKRMAVLGADVWLDEGKGLKKIPQPEDLSEGVRIFFGRDDQPRLMGRTGDKNVYLRWRGAWQKADGEIAKLASGTNNPLYGFLGHDDPEVVCKEVDGCIIKRLTGWNYVDALPGNPRVELCGTVAWAFTGASVWRQLRVGKEDKPFELHAGSPTFTNASGLWAISASDIWVAEQSTGSLHHYDGKAWTKVASPIAGPRSVWAAATGDVWIAGDGGAGHWDGTSWRRVEGVPKGQLTVYGRKPGDVWIGGSGGVWASASKGN